MSWREPGNHFIGWVMPAIGCGGLSAGAVLVRTASPSQSQLPEDTASVAYVLTAGANLSSCLLLSLYWDFFAK
jgi:hypothetical protein